MRATFAELKRRGIFRTAVVYIAVGWGAVEILATVLPALTVPPWVVRFIILAVVIGFPVAMFLSWLFEVGPDGIRRTAPDSTLGRVTIVASLLMLVGATTGLFLLVESRTEALREARELPAPPVEPRDRSLAVLDLRILGAGEDADFLSEGLADEIAVAMGRIPGLSLAARESARALQTAGLDPREIGRRLGVTHLLAGSVRRSAGRARITVTLLDGRTGFELWVRQYDREVADVLDLQSDVALAVASALQLVLSPEEKAEVTRVGTEDPQAWEFYLRARKALRDAPVSGSLDEAQELIAASLENDPDFAAALGTRCEILLERFLSEYTPEVLADAESSCRDALAEGGEVAEVHIALGRLYTHTGRAAEAQQHFDHALEMDNRSAAAQLGLAELDARQQRVEEAEAGFRRAVALQPDWWRTHNALGGFLYARGRYEEAVEAFRKVIELSPRNEVGYNNLGGASLSLNRFDDAADALYQTLQFAPTSDAYTNIGTMYYYGGRFADAVIMYRKAAELAPRDARIWANLGDAYRLISEGGQMEGEAYREAASLLREQLAASPEQPFLHALLGHVCARNGDASQAVGELVRTRELGSRDPQAWYYVALTEASLGNDEAARAALRQSIELGYPEHLLAADPQIKSLDLAVLSERGEL